MRPRFLLYAVALAVAVFFISRAVAAPEQPSEPESVLWPVPDVQIIDHEYAGLTAREWHRKYVVLRRYLTRRWQPTVTYALRLASVVYGVPYGHLHSVSGCESGHWPFARNGRYRGLFQEGPMFEASPFGHAGFSVWDPLANALTAAYTVRSNGSWRQWECKP